MGSCQERYASVQSALRADSKSDRDALKGAVAAAQERIQCGSAEEGDSQLVELYFRVRALREARGDERERQGLSREPECARERPASAVVTASATACRAIP